jgi:hypothetical protein
MNKRSTHLTIVSAIMLFWGCTGPVDMVSPDGGTGGTAGTGGTSSEEDGCTANQVCDCGEGVVGFQECKSNGEFAKCECPEEHDNTGGNSNADNDDDDDDDNVDHHICAANLEYGCDCNHEGGDCKGFRRCLPSGDGFAEDGKCYPRSKECVDGATERCSCADDSAGTHTCKDGKWGDCVAIPETPNNVEPDGDGEEYLLEYTILDEICSYVDVVTFWGMLNGSNPRDFCSTNKFDGALAMAEQDGSTYSCKFKAFPDDQLTVNVSVDYGPRVVDGHETRVDEREFEFVNSGRSWACWADFTPPCFQGSHCFFPALKLTITRLSTGKKVVLVTSSGWGDEVFQHPWNGLAADGCNLVGGLRL